MRVCPRSNAPKALNFAPPCRDHRQASSINDCSRMSFGPRGRSCAVAGRSEGRAVQRVTIDCPVGMSWGHVHRHAMAKFGASRWLACSEKATSMPSPSRVMLPVGAGSRPQAPASWRARGIAQQYAHGRDHDPSDRATACLYSQLLRPGRREKSAHDPAHWRFKDCPQEGFRSGFFLGMPQWIAPHIWHAECAPRCAPDGRDLG